MKKWHWISLITLIGITLAAQIFATHEKDEHWYNIIPAFWSVFGFVGCLLIIAVAKGLGKFFLQRKEDYYDEP